MSFDGSLLVAGKTPEDGLGLGRGTEHVFIVRLGGFVSSTYLFMFLIAAAMVLTLQGSRLN